MNFIKVGEAFSLKASDFYSSDAVVPAIDENILDHFRKIATTQKKIAPKANDFLYFSCVMMHAAEAALVNPDGTLKKHADGKEITASWEQLPNGGVKWVCSDSSIKPYANSNKDSFPEFQLLPAHKKWVGKPLCLDHKSSSVDMVRGIIVDTFYDKQFKRVIALCALDKVNYPELARKVATGVSNCVSMGTAVETAVCFDCGQVARCEADFCPHMQTKSGYCEINLGLNPIELSIVVNGADQKAKIKTVIASYQKLAQQYEDYRTEIGHAQTASGAAERLAQMKQELMNMVDELRASGCEADVADLQTSLSTLIEKLSKLGQEELSEAQEIAVKASNFSPDMVKVANALEDLSVKFHSFNEQLARLERRVDDVHTMAQMTQKQASHNTSNLSQHMEEIIAPFVAKINARYKTNPLVVVVRYQNNMDTFFLESSASTAVAAQSGEFHQALCDFEDVARQNLLSRLQGLTNSKVELGGRDTSDGCPPKNSQYMNQQINKKSYYQGGGGVNEPTRGQTKYPGDPMAEKVRDTEDRQMLQGAQSMGGPDGMFPGDEQKKQMVQRAEAEERALRRKAALEKAKQNLMPLKQSYWQGGGDVNEPTPGKTKYPKDPMAEKVRDKEDKQMTGAPPFPNVGPVDGMWPGDDKKKQMLQRAELRARFVKAANPSDGSENRGESQWQVYANGKLIFASSVNEITGGRVDALYDAIATKDFGSKMLSRFRTEDFAKVASEYKGGMSKAGQAMPAPAPMPAGDMAGMQPAPVQPAPATEGGMGLDESTDMGGAGDMKDQLPELLDQAEAIQAEIRRGVETLMQGGDELSDLEDLAGGMGGAAPAPTMATASSMLEMQKKLGKGLAIGFKQADAALTDRIEELESAVNVAKNFSRVAKENKGGVRSMLRETASETQKTLADCKTLMETLVRYAKGTDYCMKFASKHKKGLAKMAQDTKGKGVQKGKLTDKSLKPVTMDPIPGLPTGSGNIGDPFNTDLYTRDVEPSPIALTPSSVKPKGPSLMLDEYKYNPNKASKSGPGSLPEAPPRANLEQWQASMTGGTAGTGGVSSVTPTAPRPSGQNADDMMAKDKEMDEDEDKCDAKDSCLADDYKKKVEALEGKDREEAMKLVDKLEEILEGKEEKKGKDENDAVKIDGQGNMTADSPEEAGKAMKAMKTAFDLTTLEGRSAWRKAVAEKQRYSEMLDKAHPGSGPTPSLEVKPSGDLAKVEKLDEIQKTMLEVAQKNPKVKQAAENIQRLIVAGKMDSTQVEGLVANGVDPEAVKYWKAFWGQAKDGGHEFAAALTKEVGKAKQANEMQSFKIRTKRAWELAQEMARKGMIRTNASAISGQVDTLLEFDDKAFDNMKQVVANMPEMPISKTAAAQQNAGFVMPNVGVGDTYGGMVATASAEPADLRSAYEQMFAGNKRNFSF